MRVYINAVLNEFRRFFNNKDLSAKDLHVIFYYAGIKAGNDKKYDSNVLKSMRINNVGQLMTAYNKFRKDNAEALYGEPCNAIESTKEENYPEGGYETDMNYVSNDLLKQQEVCESKNIFITKKQMDFINESLDSKYSVEPEKVKIVVKFLDDNFLKGGIPVIGEDGYPSTTPIVALKGTDGQVARNMTDQQLYDMLQDKFSKIYLDKNKRNNFLKQVMKDWYYGKISKEGLLSVNRY